MKEKTHRYDDDDRFSLLVRDIPQRYCDLLRFITILSLLLLSISIIIIIATIIITIESLF